MNRFIDTGCKVFIVLVLYLGMFLPRIASAQVILNEIGTATSDDWFEIYYIPDDATVSAQLSEYKVKDSGSYEKELEGELAKDTYISFDASNRFNNAGDIIYFYKGTELLSTVKYGDQGGLCAPVGDQTLGRSPNGDGDFVVLVSSTRDSANSASQYTCPTPTPEPTTTSTPTATPSPTKSPTPTPKATKTPAPTKKPKIDEEEPKTENEILGLRDELKTPEPTESPELIEENKNSPLLAGAFIFGGVILIGAAGFPFAKNKWLEHKKSKYNKRHEEKV